MRHGVYSLGNNCGIWQVRKEVRAESLAHFRILKTFGYLAIDGNETLFADEEQVKQLREYLVEVGQAIYELDLSASPKVLASLVRFLKEQGKFTTTLEELSRSGKKLTRDELERLKDGMRNALVDLFFAMRADAGRSNRGLSRDDVRYLLAARLT
jgi:hypothetical protein